MNQLLLAHARHHAQQIEGTPTMSITDQLAGRGPQAELLALQHQGVRQAGLPETHASAPVTYNLDDVCTDALPQMPSRRTLRRSRH